MAQFFYGSDAVVKCEHVKNRFTRAYHNAGACADEAVCAICTHKPFGEHDRAASGYGAEKYDRSEFPRKSD